MRMLTYVAALGLLGLGGCGQTDYGYRPQTAVLPGTGYVSGPETIYVPRYGNPAVSSPAQERLYAHPE